MVIVKCENTKHTIALSCACAAYVVVLGEWGKEVDF